MNDEQTVLPAQSAELWSHITVICTSAEANTGITALSEGSDDERHLEFRFHFSNVREENES